MTLRLILIRHAKSDWGDPEAEDHDRVLNERGRRSAPLIGRWLAERGHVPDELLCSSAARTRETAELILGELPQAPQPHPMPELYQADAGRMLSVLQKARGSIVALIGHNPTIGDFAARIASEAPAHPDFGRYPTCACAVIDFSSDSWQGLSFGTGRVADFVVPRDLES